MFSILQGVYFLEKYDELSEIVAFGQKLRYVTDQNGLKRGPHENEFWVFSNSEMNVSYKQIVTSEKVDQKTGSFV